MTDNRPRRKLKTSPFIAKLAQILEEPLNQHLISWSPCNSAFVVHQPYLFSSTLLPKYFRHSNYGSFLRQLNFYAFTKNKSHNDDVHEFKHPLFKRGEDDSYHLIKRERSKVENDNKGEQDSSEMYLNQSNSLALKEPLSKKILDLQNSQKELMNQCKDVIQQGIQTLQWGLIRSAEMEDDSTHNRLICRRLSDLIQSYPELAQHLTYFDSQMITKLMDFLDADPTSAFPTNYKAAMSKFFRMIESTQSWMMVEMMESFFSIQKKKSKTFTIVNNKERAKEQLPAERAILQLRDRQ